MTVRALPKFMVLLVLVIAGGLAVSLRQNEEGIQSYTVQHPEPASRLIGAIIPHGEEAWFFKLTGPNKVVAEQASAFRELIKSVKFASDGKSEPSWTLPQGWKQRPGSEMRFATLQVEAGKETLDCTVTKLPMTDKNLPSYLLANINRWRDQLRLHKISESDLASSTSEIKLSDNSASATFVEFAGEMSASPMSKGPTSTTSSRPPMPGMANPAPTEKLTYDVPSGWTQGELEVSRGGVTVRRAAAFEVRDGEQRVEITVTKLPASAMLANVNRWRGQIGLESISPQQFDEIKQRLEFAKQPGDYVQFVGEKDAILGVIAVIGPEAWFVKLQGSTDLATREKQHFEEFVKSIRL